MRGFVVLAALAVWLVWPASSQAQPCADGSCQNGQCQAPVGHSAPGPVMATGQAVFQK